MWRCCGQAAETNHSEMHSWQNECPHASRIFGGRSMHTTHSSFSSTVGSPAGGSRALASAFVDTVPVATSYDGSRRAINLTGSPTDSLIVAYATVHSANESLFTIDCGPPPRGCLLVGFLLACACVCVRWNKTNNRRHGEDGGVRDVPRRRPLRRLVGVVDVVRPVVWREAALPKVGQVRHRRDNDRDVPLPQRRHRQPVLGWLHAERQVVVLLFILVLGRPVVRA